MGELTINGRREWDAQPPTCKMRAQSWGDVRELFVHWPGAKPAVSYKRIDSRSKAAGQIRTWQAIHQAKGWCDIGYSLVCFQQWGDVGSSDALWIGRGVRWLPAGQQGHNTGTLAILVALGQEDPLLESTRRRMKSLVRWCEERAGRNLKVLPHSAVNNTECPGPLLRELAHQLNFA